MPTPTYIPLANVTLGSSATTVTFSSISQTYRDLIVVINATRSIAGSNGIWLRFNGDTGTNYSRALLAGSGTGTDTFANDSQNYFWFVDYASIINTEASTHIVNVMDYSTTNKHKTTLVRGNRAGSGVDAAVGRWVNTSAITSIVFSQDSGGFAAGSTFALYGIAA